MDRQKKALATLMDHNRFPANKELLAIAAQKWSPDYSMMLMEFRFLVEVQRDLGRRGQPPASEQPPTPEQSVSPP
ncbi:MAG: hypothetical protein EOP85_07630 [Verrucomicrobiaceae bacterium]|nr:MAG: hypothetical protein EOP85_07630 [Verrucomicrobiaceae bacterium]